MSNAEVRSRVSLRLGKGICEEGPCPLCFGVMDKWGVHAESCMAGRIRRAYIQRNSGTSASEGLA